MQASLARASGANPGIPPSSLSSFLRANASIAGAVLAEFDSYFINPGYATASDTLEGINEVGIAAAAAVLARTITKLSYGDAAELKVYSCTAHLQKSLMQKLPLAVRVAV